MSRLAASPLSATSLLAVIIALVFILNTANDGAVLAADKEYDDDYKPLERAGHRSLRVTLAKFAAAHSSGTGGSSQSSSKSSSSSSSSTPPRSNFGAGNRWGPTGGGSDAEKWKKKG